MRLLRRYAPRNDAAPDFLRDHQISLEKENCKMQNANYGKKAHLFFNFQFDICNLQ